METVAGAHQAADTKEVIVRVKVDEVFSMPPLDCKKPKYVAGDLQTIHNCFLEKGKRFLLLFFLTLQ